MNAESALERIKKILEEEFQEAIILVAQVDPDAIGSAMGLAHILSSYANSALPTRIVYCGSVGHAQNRTLLNRIGEERAFWTATRFMDAISEESANRKPTLLAMVDSSQFHDERMSTLEPFLQEFGHPRIVIDHHKGCDISHDENSLVWVEEVGAASSLVHEIACLEDLDKEYSEATSTSLALGIYTDTHALLQATERDRSAYNSLQELLSKEDLLSLINFDYPESYFDNLNKALAMRKRHNTTIVTGIGFRPLSQSDDVALVASHLIRMHGISLAVVWIAHEEQKRVRISVRCRDESIDLDALLKRLFNEMAGSKKAKGSIQAEGGANIPLDMGYWSDARPDFEAIVQQQLEQKVFNGKK